jgi:1-phosphofructokinase
VIVTVTPNPSLDLTYQLSGSDALTDPAVEVHRAHAVSLEASGKGVNVSRALTRVGRPSPAVLFTGGATGRQLLDLLTAEKVPFRAVPQAGATRVNTTVLTPNGPTTKLNAPGSGLTQDELDNLVIAANNEMVTLSSGTGQDPDRWLLICGSMPPGTDAGALIGQLVAAAHAQGWRAAVDSSGPGLQAGFDAGADLLAPNAAELAAVLGPDRLPPDADLPTLAATARDEAARRGIELLISLGADGALWTDGRRTRHARGPVVVPVNSAGAGDALLAGWFSAPSGPSDPTYPSDSAADPGRRLATAVAWGTAGCLAPTTVAVDGDPPSLDSVLISDPLEAP